MRSIFLIFSLGINSFLSAGDGAQLSSGKQLTFKQLEQAAQQLHYVISDDRLMAECDIKKVHDLLRKDPLFSKIGVPCKSSLYAALAYRYKGLGLTIKMGLFEYAQHKPARRAQAAEEKFARARHYAACAEDILKTTDQVAASEQLTTFIQQQEQLAIKPGSGKHTKVIMVDPYTYKEKPAQQSQEKKQRWCWCSWLCGRKDT